MRLALAAGAVMMALRGVSASAQAAMPNSLPLERLRPGEEAFAVFSGMADSARLVIRDTVAWRRAWESIYQPMIPQPPVPAVDFGRDMIVIAALGRRPSEGFGIVIEDARRKGDAIEVGVRKTIPEAGCPTSAAITQPVDVARLPANDSPVRFRERNVVVGCGVR